MHSNNKLHGFTSVIIYGKELAKLKWAMFRQTQMKIVTHWIV